MDRSTLARTGIAGAVAGLGLAIGGVALANAADESPSAASSAALSAPDRAGGPHGHRGQDAEALATELGLKQSVVAAALEAVHDDLRPDKAADGTRPEPPTEAQRSERQAALATALAKELNISEAKVTAALAAVQKQHDANREQHRTQERAALVTRLDSAVKAGTLTEADKASVLKAFDAKILGGGPGGGRGPAPQAATS